MLAQARQQRGHGAALSQQDNDTFELLGPAVRQIEREIRPDAPATASDPSACSCRCCASALQDRGFFVRPQHPARQLLNTVAETAAKWLDEDDVDPQLLAPLQQAVTQVVEHYDGDVAVFDSASNQALQGHLQAHGAQGRSRSNSRHVEAARGKEKLEVAKLRAAETHRPALIGDQRLPKFVQALLNQAWADVLTLTLLRQRRGFGGMAQAGRCDPQDHQRHAARAMRRSIPSLASQIEGALTQVGYHIDEAGAIAQRLTSARATTRTIPLRAPNWR